MARKTKEEAERTYHALLDAATTLFIRQGIAKTTLTNIATEAGMTRGAIYWHFDNKDAVIRALWERNGGTLHTKFVHELENLDPDNPVQHFRTLIKDLVQHVVTDPEIGQMFRIIVHSVEFTDEQTELQQFLYAKHEMFHEGMEMAFKTLHKNHALKSPLSPEILAQGVISYLIGLINVYLKPRQNRLDLKQHGDELLDLYLDATLGSSEVTVP